MFLFNIKKNLLNLLRKYIPYYIKEKIKELTRKECPICRSKNSNMIISAKNSEYRICSFCGTEIKINFDFGKNEVPEWYKITTKTDDINVNIELLKNDRVHYNKFLTNLKEKVSNEDISEFLKTRFNKIYAFGGGLPKLESYLLTKEINIYDKNADYYEKGLDNFFKEYYGFNGKTKYIKFNLTEKIDFYKKLKKDINADQPVLLTFVHFLEHMTVDLFIKLLTDISRFRGDNIYYLIYQPNIEAARDKNWCHYYIIHNLFIPKCTMINLLRNKKFEIIFDTSYCDDMLIIFK